MYTVMYYMYIWEVGFCSIMDGEYVSDFVFLQLFFLLGSCKTPYKQLLCNTYVSSLKRSILTLCVNTLTHEASNIKTIHDFIHMVSHCVLYSRSLNTFFSLWT